jgi:succinyl-CoA synthetase beta subunit
MNLEEHAAKSLVLAPAGIPIPSGRLCTTAEDAGRAVAEIGPAVVKAQVPTGKRGKAGGIKVADTPEAAEAAARAILGMTIGRETVRRVLVEGRAAITRELYAAVVLDVTSRSPLVLFSTEGGMDIEEIAETRPDAIRRHAVDVTKGFSESDAAALLAGLGLGDAEAAVAGILARLYGAFRDQDAELLEVNPLAILEDGSVLALDCKFVLDDAAAERQPALASAASPPRLTELERRGAESGLKFIQLDGNVGVLANGAGLTMTTMDVIDHFGGRPANFLGDRRRGLHQGGGGARSRPVQSRGEEPGGEFLRRLSPAPTSWRGRRARLGDARPDVPAFFSIHGTGADEAVQLVRDRLGIEPFDLMEDAVKAAIEAAR